MSFSKSCAIEFTHVAPERQVQMLEEMQKIQDFSLSFCRALVLQTKPNERNEQKQQRKAWAQNDSQKQAMVSRLEHAEKQQEFYATLYRQYTADLMRVTVYVRKLLTNAVTAEYLKGNHAEIFARFNEIIFNGSSSV